MNDTNNLPERKPVFQEKPETPSRKFWRVVWGSMLGFLFASIITSLLYTIMFFGMIGIMAAGAKNCHFSYWDRIVDLHSKFKNF